MPYVHTRKKMDIFTSCVTENLHFSYSDNTTLFILKDINILCVYVRENFYIYCVRTSYLYNIFVYILLFTTGSFTSTTSPFSNESGVQPVQRARMEG